MPLGPYSAGYPQVEGRVQAICDYVREPYHLQLPDASTRTAWDGGYWRLPRFPRIWRCLMPLHEHPTLLHRYLRDIRYLRFPIRWTSAGLRFSGLEYTFDARHLQSAADRADIDGTHGRDMLPTWRSRCLFRLTISSADFKVVTEGTAVEVYCEACVCPAADAVSERPPSYAVARTLGIALFVTPPAKPRKFIKALMHRFFSAIRAKEQSVGMARVKEELGRTNGVR